jgi:hypothetical protein
MGRMVRAGEEIGGSSMSGGPGKSYTTFTYTKACSR